MASISDVEGSPVHTPPGQEAPRPGVDIDQANFSFSPRTDGWGF